jgi:hypothetical protein
LFGISKWGNGSILGYPIPLVEKDDGLVKLIHGSKASYKKVLKAISDCHPRNTPSNCQPTNQLFYITCLEPTSKLKYLI